MTLEERVERLEKLWERDRNTMEMAGILIERLTDVITKYWSESYKNRKLLMQDVQVLRDFLAEHFKAHYLDKKYGNGTPNKTERYTIK